MDNPVDTSGNPLPAQPVRVVDVDLSIETLIVLLFKIAVASVPVGIAVAVLWWLLASGLRWLTG